MSPSSPVVVAVAVALLGLLCPAPASAQGWTRQSEKESGVTLRAPRGAQFKALPAEGTWRAVRASVGTVTVTIATLPKKTITADMMRRKLEALAGLSREQWTVLKTYKGKRGWFWYCTARAEGKERAAVAVYGVGPRSSTTLVLVTLGKAEAKKRRHQLARWHRSVSLI